MTLLAVAAGLALAVLVAVLVVRARRVRTTEPEVVARFRAACAELERTVGETLLPTVDRFVEAAAQWRKSLR